MSKKNILVKIMEAAYIVLDNAQINELGLPESEDEESKRKYLKNLTDKAEGLLDEFASFPAMDDDERARVADEDFGITWEGKKKRVESVMRLVEHFTSELYYEIEDSMGLKGEEKADVVQAKLERIDDVIDDLCVMFGIKKRDGVRGIK